MRLFTCDACSNTVHFDKTSCISCGHRLGHVAEKRRMTALEPVGDAWHSAVLGRDFAFCTNDAHGACNWLVPFGRAGDLCLACRHDRTIPDLSIGGHATAFRRVVAAERHAFCSLLLWQLPTQTKDEDANAGLAFDFLAESSNAVPVTIGHDDGVITLAIAEADDAEREAGRTGPGEPYRTLLGHFRHGLGHCHWDRSVRMAMRSTHSAPSSATSGSTMPRPYAAVMPKGRRPTGGHISSGPMPPAIRGRISPKPSPIHRHIGDALETARAFGVVSGPRDRIDRDLDLDVDFPPYETADFARLAEAWPPLTVVMNTMNRSLGRPDLYPSCRRTRSWKSGSSYGVIMNAGGHPFGSPGRRREHADFSCR